MDRAHRRSWFDRSLPSLKVIAPDLLADLNFTCPCCGYPTLPERNAYEICSLCWWEDDGQDDADADEVWGGPNHDFSLANARENFERYGVMYPPDRDPRIGGADSPLILQAKQQAIEAFDAMLHPGADLSQLSQRVRAALGVLDR